MDDMKKTKVQLIAELEEWRKRNALNADIETERKLAEDALYNSEKEFRLIYDTIGDVLFHLRVEPDGSFRFMSANKAFLRVTALTKEQVIGKTTGEVIPEPYHTEVFGRYREAAREKRTVKFQGSPEYPCGRRTGNVTLVPVLDADEKCTYLVGSVHDITQQNKIEDALRESEAKYSKVFQGNPEAVTITSTKTGRIIEVNKGFEVMFGYTRSELIGKTTSDLGFWLDNTGRETVLSILKRDERVRNHLTKLRTKTGNIIVCELSAEFIEISGEQCILAITRDITKRK
jgi:PAS domain S-box-containing protein